MNAPCVRTIAGMGTIITLRIVDAAATPAEKAAREEAIERALAWFARVEADCSRFDAGAELRQVSAQIGTPVPVGDLLYEAVQFALAVAEETDGAFDPTVGRRMEARGFNRHDRSRQAVASTVALDEVASYRDVRLDPERRTITLQRPLVLDLGAVAKGLAIDLAARELQPFRNFSIDAGGDLYLGGNNAGGRPWSVGIRHPRGPDELIDTVCVSNMAVCTSGDYERRSPVDAGHHLLDPRSGRPAAAAASVTVLAPSAMVADVLATAAFVLGPTDGLRLLERHGVDGLIVTPALERFSTPGMRHD
jgi:thiamine biosynthesis lipoprotein